jgi:hypothetical protein
MKDERAVDLLLKLVGEQQEPKAQVVQAAHDVI